MGSPAIGIHFCPGEDTDYDTITNDALGLIQLTSSSEAYTQTLLLDIESIKENIAHINTLTPHQREKTMNKFGVVLTERLAFISHESKVLLWDIRYFNKRGQAQMAATFLTMPVFDFIDPLGALGMKPHFWFYWAITSPLAMFVLAMYLSYLVWVGSKHLNENKMASEGNLSTTSHDLQSIPPMAIPSGVDLGSVASGMKKRRRR
ncbi:hypothetical protein FGG08_003843 [Glutinoglossum americanum]|uniref:Uncharacterized protein n=1 Tax=Glutinoglossum americanum TaxID=1670608 RepID=A0A9P8I1M8_9PEZI|nr:hypothetical protein FGG08_003843 [Glutinoglossum americanum]